jgi:Tfp pilus assembly protein FimT
MWKGHKIKARLFSDKRGITLVELAIVLATIAILSAIMIPGYLLTMPQRRLNASAIEISSNMRYAKMYAVKSGENVGLYFNDTGAVFNGIGVNAYGVYIDNGEAGVQNQFDASDTIIKKNLQLRSGITIGNLNCPNNTVIFSVNGSAMNSAGSVEITNGSKSKKIDVIPISGIIRIS